MLPFTRPMDAEGNIKVFVITPTSDQREWFDYIPVQVLEATGDDVNRTGIGGAIKFNSLASDAGLLPFKDYIPVAVVTGRGLPFTNDGSGGYIPAYAAVGSLGGIAGDPYAEYVILDLPMDTDFDDDGVYGYTATNWPATSGPVEGAAAAGSAGGLTSGSTNEGFYLTTDANLLIGDTADTKYEEFTIECFLRWDADPTGGSDNCYIMSRWGGGFNQGTIHYYYDEANLRLIFGWSQGSGGFWYSTINFTPTAGTWYHVAIGRKFDNTLTNDAVKFCYINGVEYTINNVVGDISSADFYTGPSYTRLNIGCTATAAGTWSQPFKGDVDEVRWTDGARYDGEGQNPASYDRGAYQGITTWLTNMDGTADAATSDWLDEGPYRVLPNDIDEGTFAYLSTTQFKTGTMSWFVNARSSAYEVAARREFCPGTDSWCFEGWFYLTGKNTGGVTALGGLWRPSGGLSWCVYLNDADDNLQLSYSTNGTTGSVGVNTTYAWPLNEWVHIAAVIDRSLATDECRMYVNGTEVASSTAINSDATVFFPTVKTEVMGLTSVDNTYGWTFKGYVDSVRITKGDPRYSEDFTPYTDPLTLD